MLMNSTHAPALNSLTFSVEQIEGLPEHYYAAPEPKFTAVQRIDHAEGFFAAMHADIRYRGGRAYYAQDADYIQIPPIESFRGADHLRRIQEEARALITRAFAAADTGTQRGGSGA